MTTLAPISATLPGQLDPGWIRVPSQFDQGSVVIHRDKPEQATVAQGDFTFGFKYGARAQLNLSLGDQPTGPSFASLEQAIAGARDIYGGALRAVVASGGGFDITVLNRSVAKGLDGASAIGKVRNIRAWDYTYDGGPVSLRGVRFLDPKLVAIVDVNDVIRNPQRTV